MVLKNNKEEYFSGSPTYFYHNVITNYQFLAMIKYNIKQTRSQEINTKNCSHW